jgi:hypothetical protein
MGNNSMASNIFSLKIVPMEFVTFVGILRTSSTRTNTSFNGYLDALAFIPVS